MENQGGIDPGPAFEGEDSFLRNIHRLFFRPKAYFEGITSPRKKGWLFVFALTYGVAWALSRGDANAVSGVPDATSWGEHWAGIAAGGFIGMLLAYFLGGAWYRFRLGVCGAAQDDKDLVRRVYLSSAQVVALPMIVLEIVSTIRFSSPAAAAVLPARESIGLLVFAIIIQVWSYAASYIGVRTVFKVRKLCAATWFLILPTLFIAVLIGAIYFPAAGENAPSVPKADVSEPLEFSGLGMTFSYPGNWRVIESGPSPGIMAKVEIEGKGGAYFLLQRVETADSAESFSIKWVESMKQTLSLPTEPKAFDAWGTLKGVGRRFEDRSGDAPNEFRLFITPVAEGQLLMICETSPTAGKGGTERGFKLIRRTFRMTS
jgi:Yip1 domain